MEFIEFLSPEVLYGGAAAITLSLVTAYYIFFRREKTEPKLPSKKREEFEQLKKQVTDKKPKVEHKTLQEALSKTRESFWGRISQSFAGKSQVGALDDIEEVLYTSDLGPKTVQKLFASLEEKISADMSGEEVRKTLKNELQNIFNQVQSNSQTFTLKDSELTVWMIVGVNGAGKTTTIGKLASQLNQQGKKVMIAAGDTFRAAADEQLRVWSDRAQVEIFSPENVKDPSAVAFDAVNKAKAKGFDVVIVDTAGRLHTQKNLMEELKKIKRVMAKVEPTAPHEVILVLDANSGQNALIQAEQFHQALEVTGVILTKMDGSAKGGVAVGVACDVGLPVKMIGVGEAVEDLRPFSSQEFIDSIL